MAGRNPDEWENTIKEGMVIPLYKNKGKRDQMNNYRGICLLSMASRTLASPWHQGSESGVRKQTCWMRTNKDSAPKDRLQILVRMHEEPINENIQSKNSIRASFWKSKRPTLA